MFSNMSSAAANTTREEVTPLGLIRHGGQPDGEVEVSFLTLLREPVGSLMLTAVEAPVLVPYLRHMAESGTLARMEDLCHLAELILESTQGGIDMLTLVQDDK